MWAKNCGVRMCDSVTERTPRGFSRHFAVVADRWGRPCVGVVLVTIAGEETRSCAGCKPVPVWTLPSSLP